MTREELMDKVDFETVSEEIKDHMLNYADDKINKRKCKVRGVISSLRDIMRYMEWLKDRNKKKIITMKDIRAVKNIVIRDYIDHLIEGYSNSTVSVYMTNLKGFMTYLYNRDLIESNNYGMNLELPAESKVRHFFTPEDGLKIVEASRSVSVGSPLMNECMLRLAYDQAFRKHEIVKFKVSDYIDFKDKGVIRVFGKGKTEQGKLAFIPLLDDMREMFDKYMESSEFIKGSEFMFPTTYFGREHVSISHLDNVFNQSKKLAGVEKFNLHAYRKVFTTRMMRLGLELEDIQCMLRHSSKQVTEAIYKQVSELDQIQKLGDKMKGI